MINKDSLVLNCGTEPVNKATRTFLMECIFDKWSAGHEKIMEHYKNATSSEGFITDILEDPELATTQVYAEISRRLRPEGHWYRVREMFGDRAFKTSSDSGSVKVGVNNMYVLVPNGYGDGITRVAIFDNPADFNDCMMSYFTTVTGKDMIIYDYDCGYDPATTISGRYNIYYYEGLVAFVACK